MAAGAGALSTSTIIRSLLRVVHPAVAQEATDLFFSQISELREIDELQVVALSRRSAAS
jgi:hypothetical protein